MTLGCSVAVHSGILPGMDGTDDYDTPPTPEQQLYDWLCSLLVQTPLITPTEPELPWHPDALIGPEHDITPVIHALAAIEQSPVLHPVWDALCQWIIAHNGHVRAGHDLCNDLGVAIGEREPSPDVAAFESAPTNPIAHLVRAEWSPDHAEDAAKYVAEFVAAMNDLYRMFGREEFATLMMRGSVVIDMAELAPPLTLAPDDADADAGRLPLPAPPGSAPIEAVPSGIPVELSASAREPGAALAAALETASAYGARTPRAALEAGARASGARTYGRWFAAAGVAVALAAALAVAMLPDDTDDTAADTTPLPVFAVDYPTCPPPAERAAGPTERADAPESADPAAKPKPESSVALPAAAPPPPPAAPRRKVSTVKLTEIKGVRVRQRGGADVVIEAHEATPADGPGLYVIDADEYPGTGFAIRGEGDWSVVVETGAP